MFFTNKFRLRLTAGTAVVFLLIFFSPNTQSGGGATIVMPPVACEAQLLKNGDFELANPDASLLDWTTDQWRPSAYFSRDESNAHSGAASVKITAPTISDARFLQEVTVEPETPYVLSGWIKTENVSEGAGANLSLFGTWTHTEGLVGTNDWTRVSLWFKSGSATRITIGARLGYWTAPSSGTVWFDDLRLTRLTPDGTHPHWKILVLIYDRTDAVVTDTHGVKHHMVGAMTPAEVERAALAATQFVETDIPALTSGNMIPELTIRYPDHPLTQLETYGQAWWPSPANTAADRERTFDSVIVIWDPRVVDQYTGIGHLITGGAAGLSPSMAAGQTYLTIIIQAATEFGHRNVFKHEWGHSILSYFEAIGATPKPTVANHADINQYVHWPTGESYVWLDETDANPIPNSIYNNESGFTHDYYSGTTATADQPTRRLGITPEAWMFGGPVTKPGLLSSGTSPVIACGADIVVDNEPGNCAARLTLRPPSVFDACESNLIPVGTRSDGRHVDAPYPLGQTVVTWTVTNAANATSTCQQVVTVKDEELPMFVSSLPPITVMTGPGASSCGVVVDDAVLRGTGTASELIAIDNCSELIVNRSGVPANNRFPIGETLITYTATDASGNTASATQTVTVVDNTPPVISRVAASPSMLWPPNHGLMDVRVTYDTGDNCGISETWLSVDANEPGSGGASDWVILDAHHVRLRAARSGRWGQRVYTITISARDVHGNLSTQKVTVTVPHSNGKGDAKL